jgi:hypothetical protein
MGPATDAAAKSRAVLGGLSGIAHQIHWLEQFIEVLFAPKRPDITMGSFIKIANYVFNCLSERWTFPRPYDWTPIVWDSRYPHDGPLYPPSDVNWSITCVEMLEASARLRERAFMEEAKATPEDIEAFERRHVVGVYKRGYDFLLDKFEHARAAHFVARLSLTTPIDIACHQRPWHKRIFVEDVLPAFRAVRILSALTQGLPGHKGMSADELAEEFGVADVLCNAAGLWTITDTIASVQQSGIQNIYALHRLTDDPNAKPAVPNTDQTCDYSRYMRPIVKKFEIGMRQNLHELLPEKRIWREYWGERLIGGLFLDQKGLEEAIEDNKSYYPVQPDITFFNDTASLNNSYNGKDVLIYVDSIVHSITVQACLGLLHRSRAMADPGSLLQAFAARLVSGEEPPDVSGIEETPLGRAMRRHYEAEQAGEWCLLRTSWRDPIQAKTRLLRYLRTVFGNAAVNSLRFYN